MGVADGCSSVYGDTGAGKGYKLDIVLSDIYIVIMWSG